MNTLLYYFGVSLLIVHEMDAVGQAEWRLLFFLRDMSDQAAYPIFITLHIPAVFLVFWLGQNPKSSIRSVFRAVAAAFLLGHAIIHHRLVGAPEYGFHGLLSETLIYGAALCGIAYLLLLLVQHRARARRNLTEQ